MLTARLRLVFTLGILLAIAPVAFAQPWSRKAPQIDPSKLKDTEFTGKVFKVAPQGFLALNFGNQPITVWVHPRQTAISVTGSAEPDALKPRMHVRFTGKFDEENKISDPIKELEIYTPLPTEEKLELSPGAETQIAGSVLGFRDGELLLLTNTKKRLKLKGTLAADAKITVNLAGHAAARPGDQIKASGKLYSDPQQKQTHIFAARVDVTLAYPLGGKPGAAAPPQAQPQEKAN